MLNFNQYQIQSYGGSQDWNATTSIQDSGLTLSISGNGWKKINLPYDITLSTILELEFRSTQIGEIHGIGFDTDNGISRDRTFQLLGSQSWGYDASNYQLSSDDSGWVKYRIPVGEFFTGSMAYLTFTNDDDAAGQAESLFRNVRVFEAEPVLLSEPEERLDLRQFNFTSYAGQDRGPNAQVSDAGSTVKLQGNNWKKLAFPYEVTPDTILKFDFRSTIEGEIHGIGFDEDNRISQNRVFKLHGTQDWGLQQSGIRPFDNYGTTENLGEWKSYEIPVGEFFTGSMNYLTLVNDHDRGLRNAESFFRNIQVYEENLAPQPPLVFETGSLDGVDSFTGQLNQDGPDHLYRFSIAQTSDFNLILEDLNANADVTLRSATDGEIIDVATQGGTKSELIYQTLLAGDYTLQIESVDDLATRYDLILSATPDTAGTSHSLEVSTATYLGGSGEDVAAAIELSPRNELIVAGNFSASLGSANTLLGATHTSKGQIARLSASGREVLSVTHLGHDVNDMEVNQATGQIVVGGDFGVIVLNATGDQVLWSAGPEIFGSAVERVAIANDGTVVTLHNKTVTTWNGNGSQIARAAQVRSYVTDVEINPDTNLVYVTGFDNKRNRLNNNNPVQVAFLNAFEPDQLDQYVWQNWGFDGDILTSNGQNDMADTRGYRVTIGEDGQLYFLGEVAGGNSIFRWNGQDRSTPTLVKYDAFNDPYNSKSPHQAYFARLDPITGEIDKGQLAFARLNGDTRQQTNAFRVDQGAIAADEQGNIYISGQGFSKIQNRDINEINGQRVGAYQKSDLTALVVANDFQSRRRWTPFTENTGKGKLQGIAVGNGRAAILGTVEEGTVITTNDALNRSRLGSATDVYLATWGTDSASEFVSRQAGGAAADVLVGGRSGDLFVGYGGSDRLTGNGGADAFRYETPAEGGDIITDFGRDDQIRIAAQGFGLVAGANANLVLGNSATSSNATFLYSGGILSFDADGTGGGAPVAIATLGVPNLNVSQLRIVA